MLGRSTADARRRRLLACAAVCFFALRALVPVGFMVSLQASHAAVVLCPDYAPLPPSAGAAHAHPHVHDHAHHQAHDAAGAAGPGSATLDLPGAESHGLCPFAAAAFVQWHGSQPAFAPAAPDAQCRFQPAAADAAVARFHLSLSSAPRGPPALNLG